jgi:hypothetical protein
MVSIAFAQAKKDRNTEQFFSSISFGSRPTNTELGCTGRGSCNVSIVSGEAFSNSTLRLNKDNTLSVRINSHKLEEEDLEKIFGSSYKESLRENPTFLMEDDLILEEDVIRTLNPVAKFTKIAKGSYPITISNDYYTITLKLE